MAIEASRIQFLIDRMVSAGNKAFYGVVNQIFNYLEEEKEGNETYLRYEEDISNWNGWVASISMGPALWTVPDNDDEAKSLAYALFKKIAAQKDQGFALTADLYHNRTFAENIEDFKRDFADYFVKALENIVNDPNNLKGIEAPEKVNGLKEPKTVFIIHGHDEGFKTAVQLLIEKAKLDPVVLHEIPDRGRTVIEKLVEEGERPSFAIALLSPDDIVSVYEEGTGGKVKESKQPRPNVFLEIGYFLGKLGRDRVLLIKSGELSIPSDLGGIIFKKYDSSGTWKTEVLKEMDEARLPFDLGETVKKL